jgi:predicted SAM-dependent methyltransferase
VDVKALLKRQPRIEAASLAGWTAICKARRSGQIRRFLDAPGSRRVILGASRHRLDGWLATDLIPKNRHSVYLDATEPFPFPDGSLDRLLCEHMIEHVPAEAGALLLAEARRVLKPGGRIRLATPDLDNVLGLGAPELDDRQRRYVAWSNAQFGAEEAGAVTVINRLFHEWGHQFLYDETTLREALERAGFVDVQRVAVGHSDDADFDGIDFHGESIPAEWNDFETMVVEGAVPSA